MRDLETAMLVLTSEIGFILTVIFIIALVYMLKKKQKDEAMTHKLVQQFKEEAPGRRDNLLQKLKETFNMQEDAAQEKLHELVSREKSLYSHILKAFTGQDRTIIANLNEDIQALITAYQTLSASQPASAPQDADTAENSEDNTAELEKMMAEKELAIRERDNLKKDLNNALDSIQKLQAEYEQMYGDVANQILDKEKGK